jgi:hypothetical protein
MRRLGVEKQADDRHPRRYYDFAKGYQIAADRLLLTIEAEGGTMMQSPVYFLYAHAIELALKACMLSRELKPPRGGGNAHNILMFFDQCRTGGIIDLTDKILLFNALGQNDYQGYRYPDEPKPPRFALPELNWTKEAVNQLMAEVEPHIAAWTEAHPERSPAPSRSIGIGKPSAERRQPVPERPGP